MEVEEDHSAELMLDYGGKLQDVQGSSDNAHKSDSWLEDDEQIVEEGYEVSQTLRLWQGVVPLALKSRSRS